MKSQKDCWEALIDGYTLVNTQGDEVKPNKFCWKGFACPEDWSIKELIIKPLHKNEDDLGVVVAKTNEIIKHINGGE